MMGRPSRCARLVVGGESRCRRRDVPARRPRRAERALWRALRWDATRAHRRAAARAAFRKGDGVVAGTPSKVAEAVRLSSRGATMPADRLVIFGITGDLAKVMTFRSLYRLEQRRLLDCPIIGVAVDDWSVDQLVERARESIV